MQPWLETTAVIIVAALGVVAARWLSSYRRPYWLIGYLGGVLLIGLLLTARCGSEVFSSPAWIYLAAGRAKFVILALGVTLGLATPLSRLRNRIEKAVVATLMVLILVYFSFLPFLVPALIRGNLANLTTRIGPEGVCLQTTDYTCGPAAAVTALRKLGFEAGEGEIAILSHANPVTGTLPGSLCRALTASYGKNGLSARYRQFDSVEQIDGATITLAVIREAFMLDHYVAVMGVSDKTVTVADPASGMRLISRERFEHLWRRYGIVLRLDQT